MKYERKFERKSAFVLACAWVGERRKQYSNLIFLIILSNGIAL